MTNHLLDNVMSPEGGIQRGPAVFPPGMGGPPGRSGPPGRPQGGPPPGMGGPPPSGPMAKRLDTLENKTVYLVDIGFGGGYKFMTQLQKWFAQNKPSVTTVLKRKPGNVFSDDKNDLWEEIKANGDAVILGVAG